MRPVLLPIVAAAALAGALAGCGSSTPAEQAPGERLGRPAQDWPQMTEAAQLETVRSCRLDAAITAAKHGGATSAPYLSSSYQAVLRLPGAQLRKALDDWFATEEHRRASIAQGCTAVIGEAMLHATQAERPAADFASPVTEIGGSLWLAVPGDRIELSARLAPSGARLDVGPAPGRSRTTTHIRVAQRGGLARVVLDRVPRGVSYLRVRVTSDGTHRDRLMVVRRRPAPSRPAARTFVPMTMHGQGSQGLSMLYVPRRAIAVAQTDGAPLALTASDTVLVAHGYADESRGVVLGPGRYRDVHVEAPGAWTIRIAPAPAG